MRRPCGPCRSPRAVTSAYGSACAEDLGSSYIALDACASMPLVEEPTSARTDGGNTSTSTCTCTSTLYAVADGCTGVAARCFSISFARSGIASTTFFFAPSRIFKYIFFAVPCDVFSAR